MDEVEAKFSRRELGSFLEELASQIKNGKVGIEIPGHSKGKAKINPEQPVSVVFHREGNDRNMTIKIELEDKREISVD